MGKLKHQKRRCVPPFSALSFVECWCYTLSPAVNR
ncbi:Uncharacterised protein [Vibrio cholerae]|nr:Uncharacterised protein [Vibrio cholerae]